LSPANHYLFQDMEALEVATIQVGSWDLMADHRRRASHSPRTSIVSWIVDGAFSTLTACPNLQRLEIVLTGLVVPGLCLAVYERSWMDLNEKLMLKESKSLKEVVFMFHLEISGAESDKMAVNEAVKTFFASSLKAGIRVHAECLFS
jgi:hypothetical protein